MNSAEIQTVKKSYSEKTIQLSAFNRLNIILSQHMHQGQSRNLYNTIGSFCSFFRYGFQTEELVFEKKNITRKQVNQETSPRQLQSVRTVMERH